MAFECDIPDAVVPTEHATIEPDSVDPQDLQRVFPQGIASGGPTHEGVICWTRIHPDVYRPGKDLLVEIVPADDGTGGVPEQFTPDEVIYCGRLKPYDETKDHTVRVKLDGHLDPDTTYRYRFVYDGIASPVGRCRTLPHPEACPESVSFAVLACQDYQNGYYPALWHVAHEDVDFMLHLGDFIYEAADGRYKGCGSAAYPDREFTLPSGNALASSRKDFQKLYRTYRSDPFLQAAAAAHTSLRTWDDHSIANNRFWDYDCDAPVAPNRPDGDDPEFMSKLTRRGIEAFYDYTPARVDYEAGADHLHDAFQLYRTVKFGDLLELFITDERLFRDPLPTHDGTRLDKFWPTTNRTDPDRTMLGIEQRPWLTKGFAQATTRWTGWANEVLTLPLELLSWPLPLIDSWNGYPAEREWLYRTMQSNDTTAFVTLTGDLHSTIIGEQRLDGETVGLECMTPAVTSRNAAEKLDLDPGVFEWALQKMVSTILKHQNPYLEHIDSTSWGYATATFSRDRFTFEVYEVDKTINQADAPRSRSKRICKRRDELI